MPYLPQSASVHPGKLFVVSGPSQVGKDTIVRRVSRYRSLNLTHVITCSTRPRRSGEKNGIYLHFYSEPEFIKLRTQNEFLEWANVHGYLYGTPKKPVLSALAQGKNVILNIDVQGAAQIKKQIPETILIFITAESPEEVRRRIFASPKMNETKKAERWKNAQLELKEQPNFNYTVINRRNQVPQAIQDTIRIIKQEISHTHRGLT